MSSLSPLSIAIRVILGSGLVLTACHEPVDCALHPSRCRGVQTQASYEKTEGASAQQRVDRLQIPHSRGDKIKAAPAAAAAQVAPKNKAKADADTLRRLRLGTEMDARDRRMGDLVGRERSTATPELLLRRVRNVAANHNLAGLKRFATPELAVKLDKLVADQPARFWHHIDRYVSVTEHGFKIKSRRGDPEVGVQLEIEGQGSDISLRPLLIRTPEGYRFQRF